MNDPHQPSPMDRRDDALERAIGRGDAIARRTFVFFGALFVAGCAASTPKRVASGRLPDMDWPDIPGPAPVLEPEPPAGAVCTPPVVDAKSGALVKPEVCLVPGPVPFARPRGEWARSGPYVRDMNPMLKPKYVTVHHDGMSGYWGKTELDAKEHLRLIHSGHRGKGWGDIGYHYVIDRSGNVWQGRDVTRYQGAHVSKRNEHNIGVMCMGNFVVQRPSDEQLDALNRTVARLCAHYKLNPGNVRTHREWPGAHTACPGDNMQVRVNQLRKAGWKA